ncbi:unnamed protein product, partial [Brachionus calyciflorus]
MDVKDTIKYLEIKFEAVKSNLEKKIIDFKDTEKNALITSNYNEILSKINLSRQESLKIINELYDSLLERVTDQLKDFNAFLSNTPIETFENLNYEIEFKRKVPVDNSEIKFLREISDGKLLSSTSNEITIWSRKTWQELNSLEIYNEEISSVLPLDSYGVLIAVGFRNGIIRIWDIRTGGSFQMLRGHNYKVTSLFLLNKTEFVSGSKNGE